MRKAGPPARQSNKDVQQILANGDDGSGVAGYMAGALSATVATGGQFDYQRVGPQSNLLTGGDFQQLPQFRDVSNFNVGLYAQQAGMSLDQTLSVAGAYARLMSKNSNGTYAPNAENYEFTVKGYEAGASGIYGN